MKIQSKRINFNTYLFHLARSKKDFIYILSFLPVLLFFFSPLISWFLSLLILSVSFEHLYKFSRKLLSITSIASASVIYSSREVFLSSSDDFSNSYYQYYLKFCNTSFDSFFSVGEGFEVGINIILYTVSLFSKNVDISILMFIVSFLLSFIFVVWLEKYGLRSINNRYKNLVIASSLLFFSYGMSLQVVSQMYSSVFLLFALYSNKKWQRIISMLIGFSFHTTFLPIYVVIVLFKKYIRGSIIFVLLPMYFFVNEFSAYLKIISKLNISVIAEKFSYYNTQTFNAFSTIDLPILKYLLVLLIGFFFFSGKNENALHWKKITLGFSLIFLIFLPIPLASTRITLLIFSILYGYLLYIAFRRAIPIYMAIIYFGIFSRLYLMINQNQSLKGFFLWASYDWYGFIPFYFWIG